MNSVFRMLCSLQTLNRELADARESPIGWPLHDTTGLSQEGEEREEKKKEGEIPGNLLLTESYLIYLLLKSLSLKAIRLHKNLTRLCPSQT